MSEYVHEILSFDEDGNAIVPPSRSIILRRIKRYYRSQRHQEVTKANQEKSSTSSSSSAILQNHQKKRRLSLQKHKPSTSTKSTGAATNTTLPLGHSQERQNLMVTAGAIRTSTAIDLDPPDDISFLDNFLFEDDFTD